MACSKRATPFTNEVGILERIVTLVGPPNHNKVDAAFVASDEELTSAWIQDIGIPATSPGTPLLNGCVRKSGRTTGLTHGRIDLVDATYTNTNDSCLQSPVFEDVVGVVADDNCGLCDGQSCGQFVQGGDSGSALVNSSDQVVGLIFARSNWAWAATIQNVLGELDLTLDLSQCSAQGNDWVVSTNQTM